MKRLLAAGTIAAMFLLSASGRALAQGGAQPAAGAAQGQDSGWHVTLYPVYGWLPLYRAETRLPEEGSDGGTVRPEGETSGDLNSAVLAAARVEKGKFMLEGGFLYAGLSGEKERPLVKLEVDGFLADLRAGYELMPDFYLEAGGRQIELDTKLRVGDSATVDWNPSLLEPLIGLTYRPMIGKKWRFILHGDVGGLGTGDSSTAAGTIRFEWQPARHFLVTLGGSVLYMNVEGKVGSRAVELTQTLYGPILGIGIPF